MPQVFPLQTTPAIHSYQITSFLLAQHLSLFSSNSNLQFQSTSSVVDLLSDYPHTPTYTLLEILSVSILLIWPKEWRTLSSIFSSTLFATPHNSLILAFVLYLFFSPYHCLTVIKHNRHEQSFMHHPLTL